MSAGGLAIDTAESVGAEFPRFVGYWLEPLKPDARALTIWALLDSLSAPAPTGSSCALA